MVEKFRIWIDVRVLPEPYYRGLAGLLLILENLLSDKQRGVGFPLEHQ